MRIKRTSKQREDDDKLALCDASASSFGSAVCMWAKMMGKSTDFQSKVKECILTQYITMSLKPTSYVLGRKNPKRKWL